MAHSPSLPRSLDSNGQGAIVHVNCANRNHPKALSVATTYDELLCFCPECEHVWDCDKPPKAP